MFAYSTFELAFLIHDYTKISSVREVQKERNNFLPDKKNLWVWEHLNGEGRKSLIMKLEQKTQVEPIGY